MTYKKLYQSYLAWTNKLSVEPQKEIDANASLVREVRETEAEYVLEAFHTIDAYTDRLHQFTFSELVTANKKKSGDTNKVLKQEYHVLNVT